MGHKVGGAVPSISRVMNCSVSGAPAPAVQMSLALLVDMRYEASAGRHMADESERGRDGVRMSNDVSPLSHC